jgi:hypothetical protein
MSPRHCGWTTTAVVVERIRRLAARGAPLIYSHYDGVDRLAYEYGLREEFFAAERSRLTCSWDGRSTCCRKVPHCSSSPTAKCMSSTGSKSLDLVASLS